MNRRSFFIRSALLLSSIGLLLAGIDLALDMSLRRSRWISDVVDIQTPSILLAKLDYLRQFNGYKVVLLGDSVVYGRSLYEHGDQQWREHTLSALLEERFRRQIGDRDVLVMNLAINGALPADVERMAELIKGCTIDLLVFDVGLRSFSADFCQPNTLLSREWLARTAIDDRGRLHTQPADDSLAQKIESRLADQVLNHWTLYRLRDFFQYRALDQEPRQFCQKLRNQLNSQLGKGETADTDDEFVLLMKARERFATIDLGSANAQRQALERLLASLAARKQATVVFYAKENPEVVSNLLEPERYAELTGQLAALIGRYTGDHLAFIPAIDELGPQNYLDHIHIDHAGNLLLVERLCRQHDRLCRQLDRQLR